jgi:hypothetical protein
VNGLIPIRDWAAEYLIVDQTPWLIWSRERAAEVLEQVRS